MVSIAESIKASLVEGQLPCAVAFAIAEQSGADVLLVGQAADALDIRLSKCQLGLFGYGPKAEGKHRRVQPMRDVPPELAEAIRAGLGKDGRLSCATAWRIAAELGLARQAVSDAVEGLGLRIGQCQLGAF